MSTELRQAQAKLLANLEQTWKQWNALVTELELELELEQAAVASGNPDDDLFLSATRTIEPKRANLPPAVRKQMEAIIEARRQEALSRAEQEARQANRPLPSTDQVYIDLLRQIRRELNGEAHPAGLALVFWEGQLMEFDHRRVAAATSVSDYLAVGGGGSRMQKPQAIVGGVGVVVVGLLLLRFLFHLVFGGGGSGTIDAPVDALVANTPVRVWDVRRVAMAGAEVDVTTMSAGYPLRLCIAARPEPAMPATVVVTGTRTVRIYESVRDPSGDLPDVTIAQCGKGVFWAGRLVSAATSRVMDAVQLEHVIAEDASVDPNRIPQDRMRVVVEVRGSSESGTLVLADGSRWAATSVTPMENGRSRQVYLVPVSQHVQDAAWEVQEAGSPLPAILSVQIPAPMNRTMVLARRLGISNPVVKPAGSHGDPWPTVALTVAVRDGEPLQLQRGDILLLPDGTSNAIPAELPLPAIGGEPTTLVLPLPMRGWTSLEVRVGTWRAVITRTEEGTHRLTSDG